MDSSIISTFKLFTMMLSDPVIQASVIGAVLFVFTTAYFTVGFTSWSLSRGKSSSFKSATTESPHRKKTKELAELHSALRQVRRGAF